MIENEIRQKLRQYLDGQASLAEFQRWFVPATWDIQLTGEFGAIELTGEIELRLAEHSSGHLHVEAMNEEFRNLLSRHHLAMVVGEAPAVNMTTGTSARTFYKTVAAEV